MKQCTYTHRWPCPCRARRAQDQIDEFTANTGTEARVPPSPPVTVGRPNGGV